MYVLTHIAIDISYSVMHRFSSEQINRGLLVINLSMSSTLLD